MDALEQSRFDALYAQHLSRAKRLRQSTTIRARCRVAAYFDRCPDQLSAEDYKTYAEAATANVLSALPDAHAHRRPNPAPA